MYHKVSRFASAGTLKRQMMREERGFSMIDVIVAVGVGAMISLALVALAARLTGASARVAQTFTTAADAERLLDRIESDAQSAWAIARPPTDQLGDDNSDGHEIDFYSEDYAHRPYGWAYRFDSATGAVTFYRFVPGTPSSSIAGQVVATFSSFAVSDAEAPSQLSDPTSPAYDPLFAGSTTNDVAINYPSLGVAGGNALLSIHIVGPGVDRTESLGSANAPTDFTVIVDYTPSPTPTITATPPTPTLAPSTPTP